MFFSPMIYSSIFFFIQPSAYRNHLMPRPRTKTSAHVLPPPLQMLHNPRKDPQPSNKWPTLAPGQVEQAPAHPPKTTAHHRVLHPLVQPLHHTKIKISSIIINSIEHPQTAAASPKCQYPSAHSSLHTHHPYLDHLNSTCKIHESRLGSGIQGGR